jgi:hypothetical protein
MFSASADAQTTLATQNVTATVTVNNLARLTVGGPVTFADADPDSNPTVTAAPIGISARARVAPTTVVNLTVIAGASHFDAPGTTIPVTGLTWAATGTDFLSGTMSSAAAQSVGSWTGPANKTSSQTYTLENLWSYAPGTHSVTLTYTLSTP